MATYPYLNVPTKLKQFFGHIQGAGVPKSVTTKYLEQVGYKSKQDRSIITVLKAIGFLDSSGAPTSYWQHYRNKGEAPAILAKAIKEAYADLFSVYPDAHRKDTEALRNYFSTHTKVGDQALQRIVSTFQALCELADFAAEAPSTAGEPVARPASAPAAAAATVAQVSTKRDGITINVNIELGLPQAEDPKIYDNFFAALKKHILT